MKYYILLALALLLGGCSQEHPYTVESDAGHSTDFDLKGIVADSMARDEGLVFFVWGEFDGEEVDKKFELKRLFSAFVR
tara:strand:+ start:3761 stop:3997 length:237 start_codon:yes stop_codon:yes gene_type:complete